MRWPVVLVLTIWLGAVDSRAQNYPTPGFDCASISTPQELRICRLPRLAELDGRHWYLAERAIKGSRDAERTRSDVEGWIDHVRNECETDRCLVDAYTARIAELERNVAKLAPLAVPPQPAAPPAPVAAKPAIVIPAPVTKAPASVTAPKSLPAVEPAESETPWPWLLAALLLAAAVVTVVVAKK